MKIQILQSIAGHAVPHYRLAEFGFPPGAVIEINDELAAAWVEAGIAKPAKKGQELTMPVEVYTLPEPKPEPEPDTPVIDWLNAALFLQSRGYKAETPEEAQSFFENLQKKQRAGFLADLAAFELKSEKSE